MNIVVDVSVAVKWALPSAGEPLSDEAFDLLDRYSKGEVYFSVPDLFWAELANVLWNAVRRRRLALVSATEALSNIQDKMFPTFPTLSLLDEAFRIATRFDRTVYDSLYIALAVTSKAILVTADEKLANAVSSHLPVTMLGSI